MSLTDYFNEKTFSIDLPLPVYDIYVVSVKDNPVFAAEDETIDICSITIKFNRCIKRKWWQIFKPKYTPVEEYKQVMPKDNDLIIILEPNYPDRVCKNGKIETIKKADI